MMIAFSALILVLIGGAIFVAELVWRRRARLAVEDRVNLIARDRQPTQTEAIDAFGGLLKAGTKKIDILTQRIFTVGIKRKWAMQAYRPAGCGFWRTVSSLSRRFFRSF